MKGSAPKWPATGSQVLVHRKDQPKIPRAWLESSQRMTPMVAVMANTERAKPAASARKLMSASRDGRRPTRRDTERDDARLVSGGGAVARPSTSGPRGGSPVGIGRGGTGPT